MPAKVKVTKEMIIIDAAFEVAREAGAENINARTVSEKLNCSMLELIDADELIPVLSVMQEALGMGMEQTKNR